MSQIPSIRKPKLQFAFSLSGKVIRGIKTHGVNFDLKAPNSITKKIAPLFTTGQFSYGNVIEFAGTANKS
ncbi:hypothetical protein CJP73_13685 [Neopusillimonas maritima]|uniref:Uncharacterized protein n=1 Tax=Neopusillimonas maritima TaxID=2026239 RepID=A0A3A1YQ94_9BURK|nr:hypothetical protein CJP73_13685 [Neopusillimonas maritima]